MAILDHPGVNGTVGRESISVKNPVTGEHIGSVPTFTREDVSRAVERARAAQPAWEALGTRERARLLSRWIDLLWEDRPNAMQIIRRETGKADASALAEVVILDNVTDYYAHHAPRWLAPKTRRPLIPLVQRARVYYKPHGVAALITPWNYPLLNAFVDTIPALIAGNAAVLKPSEITPFTAQYAVDLMHRAGISADVAQIVTGDASTAEALIDNADYVAFTGSTATGRKVAVRAAGRLIPYSLELGGKDPMIVLKDADLDLAASSALRGAMENAGQTCISIERVYVEDGVYDDFIGRVRTYADQLMCGTGDGFDVHVGSLTNERELRRVEDHVADALAKGAQVLCGGQRRPDLGPLFYAPTVLVNVDHTMKVMQEETFGPIVPIMRVKDADDAVRMANDSVYGLSAAVYTRDLKRGEQIATRIQSGDVSVNRAQMIFGTPSLPMGGRKDSGIGRRGGQEGLMRFVTPQSVLVDSMIGASDSLSHMEPTLYKLLLLQRRLRKYVPFLRP
jgi:succinate-semialdehyde dehydrogenase / glutarate-semialdehyde dehydrogenase